MKCSPLNLGRNARFDHALFQMALVGRNCKLDRTGQGGPRVPALGNRLDKRSCIPTLDESPIRIGRTCWTYLSGSLEEA